MFTENSAIATFGGKLVKLSHQATTTNCKMNVNVFFPPQAEHTQVPVLVYLSGLTCTPDNCSEKGFFNAHAAKYGIAIVYPDTSPRGTDLGPEETESWDFGAGAGFYIDATAEPWSKHYNMYSYITEEFPNALFAEFGHKLDSSRVSITGHSMGGYGALALYLKNPTKYKSVSAFAPICDPSNCPWGQKAFSKYFGTTDKSVWAKHNPCSLIEKAYGPSSADIDPESIPEILIDVGTGDKFYKDGQLLPENLSAAAEKTSLGGRLFLRMQPHYDHSYYFISSFAQDHVEHAAKYLCD